MESLTFTYRRELEWPIDKAFDSSKRARKFARDLIARCDDEIVPLEDLMNLDFDSILQETAADMASLQFSEGDMSGTRQGGDLDEDANDDGFYVQDGDGDGEDDEEDSEDEEDEEEEEEEEEEEDQDVGPYV